MHDQKHREIEHEKLFRLPMYHSVGEYTSITTRVTKLAMKTRENTGEPVKNIKNTENPGAPRSIETNDLYKYRYI